MMRFSTIFFCILLAAAAAGRYQAEAGVRAQKAEIEAIEQEIAVEQELVEQLDLEVEVLESSSRLSQLAVHRLDLTAVKPYQLQTAEEFAAILEVDTPEPSPLFRDRSNDFIVDAIAMADFSKVR